ncbi:MAG: hypothetical protein IJ106_10545 [Parasporobacterium sp.]|nr:hypothetical protein [Parasporobacterium sp.]
MIKFSDRTYNFLKWVICIVLPAICTAVISVGEVFAWQAYTDPISKCIVIVQTMLGAIFCIGNVHYYQENISEKANTEVK